MGRNAIETFVPASATVGRTSSDERSRRISLMSAREAFQPEEAEVEEDVINPHVIGLSIERAVRCRRTLLAAPMQEPPASKAGTAATLANCSWAWQSQSTWLLDDKSPATCLWARWLKVI